jgi:hypothetical protein
MNTKISYLYRDASNYKDWGSVVLTGVVKNPASFEKKLRKQLDCEEKFIASQVKVPEVFPYSKGAPGVDDHCWHEFDSVTETEESPTDSRTPEQFLADVTAANTEGWLDFDPENPDAPFRL